MHFIAFDNQPFTIVEDMGYYLLLHHLEPRYQKPSHHYFSDACIPALYDLLAKHVYTILIEKQADHISFSMDIWTSDVS